MKINVEENEWNRPNNSIETSMINQGYKKNERKINSYVSLCDKYFKANNILKFKTILNDMEKLKNIIKNEGLEGEKVSRYLNKKYLEYNNLYLDIKRNRTATVRLIDKSKGREKGEIINLESECSWDVVNGVFNIICNDNLFNMNEKKFFKLAIKYKCKKISLNSKRTFTRNKKKYIVQSNGIPKMLKVGHKKNNCWGL